MRAHVWYGLPEQTVLRQAVPHNVNDDIDVMYPEHAACLSTLAVPGLSTAVHLPYPACTLPKYTACAGNGAQEDCSAGGRGEGSATRGQWARDTR